MGYQALHFCPDEKLARVVSQVFGELDFAVDPVNEPFAAVKQLMAQHYDAIVVDCGNEQNAALLFKSARNSSFNQGSLAIALVEGQAGVAQAYRIGANLVLTKPINIEQAKGTLRVARGLLRKSSGAATAVSHAAAAKSSPAPTAHSIQSAIQNVEAVSPPPAQSQSPEFEAPLAAMAASAKMEEKPVPAFESVAQNGTPVVAQVPAAPAPLAFPETAEKEAPVTEAPKPSAVPVVSTTSRSRGAASAPAPAKEVAAPAKKQAEKDEREEFAGIDPAAQLQAKVSTGAVSISDSTPFTVLGDEDTGGSGGSKKVLIAVVAVLVLAAAGYFGWTKFGQGHPNVTPRPATSTPQKGTAPAPELRPMATPAQAPSAGMTNRASAITGAPAPKTSSAQPVQPSASVASKTRIALRPEPEPKEPASAPLLVNPATTAVKTQAQTEESSAQLPSPLAVASRSDSGLGGVLSSESSSLPKPVLAQIRISQGVSQGLLIKRVQPMYPANALAAHTEGTVQIEATINEEGNVVNPKVVSGNRTLAAAALEAVRQWRYKPYYLDGKPVEIQTQITVNFKTH